MYTCHQDSAIRHVVHGGDRDRVHDGVLHDEVLHGQVPDLHKIPYYHIPFCPGNLQ